MMRVERRQHTVDPEVVQRTTGIGGLQPGLGHASPSSPHPGRGSGALIHSTHRQGRCTGSRLPGPSGPALL